MVLGDLLNLGEGVHGDQACCVEDSRWRSSQTAAVAGNTGIVEIAVIADEGSVVPLLLDARAGCAYGLAGHIWDLGAEDPGEIVADELAHPVDGADQLYVLGRTLGGSLWGSTISNSVSTGANTANSKQGVVCLDSHT